MAENISIRMDGGDLTQAADGKITMGNNPNLLIWFGLVFFGVLAVGMLAVTIAQILDDSNSSLGGAFIAVGILGYAAFSMSQRIRRGQIIIDPTLQKIKS